MLTDVRPVSNGRKWHIDHINNSADADEAMRRAWDWVRAELRDCQLRRPQDADGFRWQIAHLLAGYGLDIHNHHPADEFRANPPKLAGGGWVPKPGSRTQRP
jgi:hypothetical protein